MGRGAGQLNPAAVAAFVAALERAARGALGFEAALERILARLDEFVGHEAAAVEVTAPTEVLLEWRTAPRSTFAGAAQLSVREHLPLGELLTVTLARRSGAAAFTAGDRVLVELGARTVHDAVLPVVVPHALRARAVPTDEPTAVGWYCFDVEGDVTHRKETPLAPLTLSASPAAQLRRAVRALLRRPGGAASPEEVSLGRGPSGEVRAWLFATERVTPVAAIAWVSARGPAERSLAEEALAKLTPRQREVVPHVLARRTYREIATPRDGRSTRNRRLQAARGLERPRAGATARRLPNTVGRPLERSLAGWQRATLRLSSNTIRVTQPKAGQPMVALVTRSMVFGRQRSDSKSTK